MSCTIWCCRRSSIWYKTSKYKEFEVWPSWLIVECQITYWHWDQWPTIILTSERLEYEEIIWFWSVPYILVHKKASIKSLNLIESAARFATILTYVNIVDALSQWQERSSGYIFPMPSISRNTYKFLWSPTSQYHWHDTHVHLLENPLFNGNVDALLEVKLPS